MNVNRRFLAEHAEGAEGPPASGNLDEDQIGSLVITTAIQVHRILGPGLLESVYEAVLARELTEAGLFVARQVPIPIEYGAVQLSEGFRADLVVNGKVLVELKSVEKVADVHRKQVLTYLRLSGFRLGYILNFGGALMREGIVRIVNGLTP